jgi:adenylate cyclase
MSGLLDATLRLIAAAAATDKFRELRAGVARGPAFHHAGDWYGNSVNLASRITGVAPAGTVLATSEAADAASDAFEAGAFGEATLKGIDQPIALYTVSAA